jgi:hypothetical protein
MRAGALLAVGLMLVSGSAFADVVDAGGAGDVRALQLELDQELSALSTSDCFAACRALGSIRRAAEKICQLEPGPRCDAAREKAADATRRVHEACPDCALASGPPSQAPPAPAPPEREGRVAADQVQAEAAPSRGGCRSCSATDAGGTGTDLGLIAVLTFAAARMLGAARPKKERRDL